MSAAETAPAGPATADGRRIPNRRRVSSARTVLLVSSLGIFMAFVDATIVEIAFPAIRLSFPETDISSLSWVLNAYNIVLAAFLVAAGLLADLVGRRRIFLAGIVVFTVASGLCAIAGSADELIAFRVLQGLGAALMVPSSLGLVLNAFPPDKKAHAVALISAVAALAAGLGPTLGGVLIALSSWRLVFIVNVPVGIAAYLLSRHHLVESRSPGRRRVPDLIGTFVFAFAIATLVLAVVKGEEWGWTSGRVLGAFAASIVLTAYFVWRCTWHRAPIVDLALLRIRTFSVANGMTMVTAVGFYGYTLTNVLFLTGVWQYSVLEAGLAITPGAFVAAAVAGPTSAIAERFGHRVVLVSGGIFWGLAVFWFVTQVGLTPNFVSEWLPGVILLGIGAGTLLPNISGAAIAAAPGTSFATATALNSVARQVGASLGLAIAIAVIGTPGPLDAAQAFDNSWTFAGICLLAAGVGCLGVGRIAPEVAQARIPSIRDSARALLGRSEPAAPPPPPPPVRPAPVRPPATPAGRAETPADFLARAPIFASLSDDERESVAARSQNVSVAAGEWLFREGDEADSLYVVRAGRLNVVAESSDAVIRELGRGAVLGELALLTSSSRSASVVGARDSEMIRIDQDDFDRLLREAPGIAIALSRTLGAQLASTAVERRQPRARPATIAVLALDDDAQAREFGTLLAKRLGQFSKVEVLDGERAPAPEGSDPVSVFAPLLDSAEMGCDQVIMLAGSAVSPDPWTTFCLQQADRVLALTTASEGPPEGFRRELTGCDLVSLGVAQESGALAPWMEALRPVETHALGGVDDGAGLGRVARGLAGRSVGLVLSGGGARALAHVGVLRELVDAGIEIDRVGGVDMGAYVGGMFAMGMDLDEIDARCFEEWVRRSPLGDYTIPRHSLIRGDRVRAALARTFGDVAIEELPRGFFSSAADLRSGETVVLRSGPLREAVGMSLAIPVLGPPLPRGERLMANGSLVDNLPVGEMASLGEGPVIAVDVRSDLDEPEPDDSGEDGLPGVGETLMRVLALGGGNSGAAGVAAADLTVTPRAEGVGLLEFHQIDEAIEAGRIAAREALELATSDLFVQA